MRTSPGPKVVQKGWVDSSRRPPAKSKPTAAAAASAKSFWRSMGKSRDSRGRQALLVEGVAGLVQGAEEGLVEVPGVVAGGDADVAGAEGGAEGVGGLVEAAAGEVEADGGGGGLGEELLAVDGEVAG